MKYIVAWAYSLASLEEEVNEKMDNGYLPQGGLAVMAIEWENPRKGYSEKELYYHQAMLKKGEGE